ncbi:6097_t:CDS:2, partial [Acaulospora colombiana]
MSVAEDTNPVAPRVSFRIRIVEIDTVNSRNSSTVIRGKLETVVLVSDSLWVNQIYL